MKPIFRFISITIFLAIGLFVLLNISNSIALETSFLSLRANVGFLILFCVVLSILATILFLMSIGSKPATNVKKQIEDAKLGREIEFTKVIQLEAKIKTLEEALKKAVSDRDAPPGRLY